MGFLCLRNHIKLQGISTVQFFLWEVTDPSPHVSNKTLLSLPQFHIDVFFCGWSQRGEAKSKAKSYTATDINILKY